MNNPLRLRQFLALVFLLLLFGADSASARKDSVYIIQSPGGSPYRCCYDFIVQSRQDSGVRIAEFRAKIISQNGVFIPGQSDSPFDWTIFQQQKSAQWLTNTTAAELDSAEIANGFHICVADTGVFRMVWETWNLSGKLSSDTLSFICLGSGCDEPFFTPIRGTSSCVLDVDLANANRVSRDVNDFHVKLLTPGARLAQTPSKVPSGWSITKQDTTLVSYFTSNALSFGDWVQGFRLAATSPTDTLRIAWWTTYFGELICTDTIRVYCGRLVSDSLRIIRSVGTIDSCCADLVVRNTHLPTTTLDAVSIKVITANARLGGLPVAPSGWTRQPLNAAGDSIAFTSAAGLGYRDSVTLRNLCFDNSGASSDTVRYRVQSIYRGVVIYEEVRINVCPRPLTQKDVVTARVDSTVQTTRRCVSLTLKNMNSRNTAIERFVVRISNPGKARQIIAASAPAGWNVTFKADSAVYTGSLAPGGTLGGFEFCVGIGDTAMHDPLRISWKTSNALGDISSDTLSVKINIVIPCDSISWSESSSTDADVCCFKIRLHNGNKDSKNLDGLLLTVVNPSMIATSAEAGAPWNVSTPSFPSATIGFSGGPLAPGDSTPEFTICINVQSFSARPLTIPVAWRSFANGGAVCSDTLKLVCSGVPASECDTVKMISNSNEGDVCVFGFRVVNLHNPASNVDAVEFRRIAGKGTFVGGSGTGGAAGWNSVLVKPDTVVFTGDSILTLDSADTFILRVDSTDGTPLQIQACTRNKDILLCCSELTVQCATAGVEEAITEGSTLQLLGVEPNPFSTTTTIRFRMHRSGDVRLTLRDAAGNIVHHVEHTNMMAGEGRIMLEPGGLASGVYFYTIEAGGSAVSGRLVLVR